LFFIRREEKIITPRLNKYRMSGPIGLIKWGEVIKVGNGEMGRGDRGVLSLRN